MFYHRLAEKLLSAIPLTACAAVFGTIDLDECLRRGYGRSGGTVVSFDAFDTLITMPLARPSDLFLLHGHGLAAQGRIACTPEAWRDTRLAAERQVRLAAGRREVMLDEIYDAMDLCLPRSDVDALKASEVALELSLIRPVMSNVVRLCEAAEIGPTAVLSDVCLPEPALRRLLEACGIDLGKTPVHASSATGTTKASGPLFARVARTRRHRIHIGDNLYADVWRALHAGCRAFPFVEAYPNRLERLALRSLADQPLLGSVLAGSMRSARLRTTAHERMAMDIAAAASGFAGPVLLAFVVWIVGRAKADGIDRLYFFARGGEVLHAIASRIVRDLGLALECRYLCVSRQALHLATLIDIDGADFSTLKIEPGQTLDAVLRTLDLDEDSPAGQAVRGRLDELGLALPRRKPLKADEIDVLTAALRSDPVLTALVARSAADRRLLLVDYLRQEKVFAPGRIGVVGTGWQGNLQRSLKKVAETAEPLFSDRLHGYYFGLYGRQSGAGRLNAFIDQPEAAGLRPYVRGTLVDVVCAASHGATLRYERAGSGIRPVFATPDNPEADAWGLAYHRDTIDCFADDVMSLLDAARLNVLDQGRSLTRVAVALTAAFVGQPTRREARALGSFPHAADAGHALFEEISPPLPLSPAAWYRRLRAYPEKPLISYWPEASVARTIPAPAAGVILRLMRWRNTRPGSRATRPARRTDVALAAMPVAENPSLS